MRDGDWAEWFVAPRSRGGNWEVEGGGDARGEGGGAVRDGDVVEWSSVRSFGSSLLRRCAGRREDWSVRGRGSGGEGRGCGGVVLSVRELLAAAVRG